MFLRLELALDALLVMDWSLLEHVQTVLSLRCGEMVPLPAKIVLRPLAKLALSQLASAHGAVLDGV